MVVKKEFVAQKNQKVCKLVSENVEDISFSSLRKILRSKDIKVNGKRISTDVGVLVGDVVEVYYTPLKLESFSVIFVDDNLLVVNKKSGFTSEKVYSDVSEKFPSAGFVHRLDRNTSGVMVFSLNAAAETELLKGFRERTFEKKYLATVYGTPKIKSAILTAYLVKKSDESKVKIYSTPVCGAVKIKTGYEVLRSYDGVSDLEVTLYTGKTHQIRAHLAFIGHFIVGDGKYGDNSFNKSKGAKSQMLKAYKLTLKFNETDFLFYLDGKTFTAE